MSHLEIFCMLYCCKYKLKTKSHPETECCRDQRADRQRVRYWLRGDVWREGGGGRGGVQRSAAECRALQGPAVLHTVDPSTNLLSTPRLLGLTGPRLGSEELRSRCLFILNYQSAEQSSRCEVSNLSFTSLTSYFLISITQL